MSMLLTLGGMPGLSVTVLCQNAPKAFCEKVPCAWVELPLAAGKTWSETSTLGRLAYSWRFRRHAERLCREIKPDLVWFGSAETGWLFEGSIIFKNHRTVAHILELYAAKGIRHKLNGRLCRRATTVVACESNRAWIMRVWYGLKKTPYVLPNKPSDEMLVCSNEFADLDKLKARINGRFTVLYQGAIMKERIGFSQVAKAVAQLGSEWAFLCMGRDHLGLAAQLEASCDNFIYAGYIPAPKHLEVTRLCHVGVVSYEPDSLNTVFCAPNKTWEYMGMGLSLLCSDLPGLVTTVRDSNAGESVDFNDIEAIKGALVSLRARRDGQRVAALSYFNAVPVTNLLKKILSDAVGVASVDSALISANNS